LDLKEIGWNGFNWIHIVQNGGKSRPVVNKVMNSRITKKCRKRLGFQINY